MTELSGGCGRNAEEKTAEAENLLREKYGEIFVVDSYQGSNLTEGWYSAQAYAKEDPDMLFSLTVDQEGRLADTYVQHRVAQKMTEEMEMRMKEADGGYYLYSVVTTMDTISVDAEMTMDTFDAENPTNEYIIYLYYDQERYGLDDWISILSEAAKENSTRRGYFVLDGVSADALQKIQDFSETNDVMLSEYKTMDDPISIRFDKGVLSENN